MLMVAHMLLGGKKLYVDIMEVNPPLIFWWYTIPSWLAVHMPLFTDYEMLALLGVLVTSGVIVLAVRLVSSHPLFAQDKQRQAWFAALLFFVFIFQTSPAYFFDREHIFLVLTFPYVLLLLPDMPRLQLPLRLRLPVALLAGLGFCVKPHTLILFIGLQLLTLYRERSARILFSPENAVIYITGALYLLAMWVFTPLYFTLVLPMASASYVSYDSKWRGFSFFGVISLLIFGVTFVDFRPRFYSPYRRYIYYFLAVCLCWLCYALAGNGWGYTYNPLSSTLLIAACFMLWHHRYLQKEQGAKGQPVKQFRQGAYACVLVLVCNALLILTTFIVTFSFHCEEHKGCSDMRIFEKRMGENSRPTFGALVMDFNLLPEIHRLTGAELATRYYELWMLPGFPAAYTPAAGQHAWIRDYVAKSMASDLEHNKPDTMLVDTSDEFPDIHRHIDLIALFSTYPEFKAAWSHYRYVSQIDRCRPPGTLAQCRFTLYRRTP
jgi:hypothetical protein